MNKRTIIFLFTTLFVVLFLVIGFFVVKQVYAKLVDGLIDQYAQEELILAKQTAAVLESEVSSAQDKLKLVAKIPEIRDGNTAVCEKKLAEIVSLHTRLSNIGRVGIDKKFRCSLNKALIGTDAERLGPYITQIFSDPAHKAVLSRIIKVPNGGYAVAIHVPVFNDQGVFAGTIGGAIYFDDFSKKFLNNIKVSNNGYIVLQDDDGTIFYHPQTELIGQNRRPKTPAQDATASAITKLIIKSSLDGSEGYSKYISSLDQKEKVGAYSPANVFPGRRWIVTVTVPIEDIQGWTLIKNAQKAFSSIFLLVIVSLIFPPILLLVYLDYSIFRPLVKIGTAAGRVGEGDLNVVIPIKSKDEIGVLAGFFNTMVKKLKNSYGDLEKKVKEKTAELTEKVEALEKNTKATQKLVEDLKIQKEKLLEKDKELADAQRAGSVGSFAIDLASNSISISEETYRLYGLDPARGQTTVANLLNLIYKEDRDNVKKQLAEATLLTEPFEFVFRSKHKNGEMHWLKARAKTVFSSQKQPLQIIGTIQDITKEYEIDKAKSEFVSLASHQLRTPLSAINWYTEMLINGDAGKITAEQKKYLDEVYTANQRMVELVNSLLNVSRIELGTFIIEPEQTDIADMAKSVVKELKPQIEKQKQKINEHYNPIPEINVDKKLMRMIIQNLLSNAVKYTPEKGAIDVSINTTAKDLHIEIKDTGFGIPKDQQDKIFTKLFRADNVRAKDMEGTGLGLYIIKSIIDQVGGKIWFESKVDKGTTFFVTLPLEGMKKNSGTKSLS